MFYLSIVVYGPCLALNQSMTLVTPNQVFITGTIVFENFKFSDWSECLHFGWSHLHPLHFLYFSRKFL